jgi:acetyl-CoA C-acetyltransferase
MPNPRTPVLIGASQILYREQDLQRPIEPIDMMLEAVRCAEQDAQSKLLDQVQSVRVIRGLWRYGHPGRFLAEQIGAPQAQTVGTLFGGNQVQAVVHSTCREILRGDFELVVMTGAENGHTLNKAHRAGIALSEKDLPGKPDVMIGAQEFEHHKSEVAKGIRRPTQVYSMYENAIRFQRGESIPAHLERISGLWARFNEIALENPNAWIQTRYSAEEIRTPSGSNRPISFPYPKLMNANSNVDMSAALILCSIEKARALGVPEARWIYPLAGSEGYDHFCASIRDNFHSSPAIRLAGRRLMDMAGIGTEEIDYIDLYSCFPSVVQIGAQELGLDEERPLTVTGGLTFGGGPLNNYVMHSIARMVELLREEPSRKALVTANGGNIYKHAMALYSGVAPSQDFQFASVQDEIDQLPARSVLPTYSGAITLESYSVMYEGDSPSVAHCSCLTPEGERTWINQEDPDLMQAMTEQEFCGRAGEISSAGELKLS